MVNGFAALALGCATALRSAHGPVPVLFALAGAFGTVAGLALWRGRMSGFAAGLLCCGLQSISYTPFNAGWTVSANWVVSLGIVLRLPGGVMVVNTLAVALLVLLVALLWRRLHSGAGFGTMQRRDAPGHCAEQ